MARLCDTDTRKQKMDAYLQLSCQVGYDAAYVAEICDLACVSKDDFHHSKGRGMVIMVDSMQRSKT
jgi:hypothetical protein